MEPNHIVRRSVYRTIHSYVTSYTGGPHAFLAKESLFIGACDEEIAATSLVDGTVKWKLGSVSFLVSNLFRMEVKSLQLPLLQMENLLFLQHFLILVIYTILMILNQLMMN